MYKMFLLEIQCSDHIINFKIKLTFLAVVASVKGFIRQMSELKTINSLQYTNMENVLSIEENFLCLLALGVLLSFTFRV